MTGISIEKVYNFKEVENNWSEIWQKYQLFKTDITSEAPSFSLMLLPPEITNNLQMDHAITYTIADILIRRKKMQGFNILWLSGLNQAGISTQKTVEKKLNVEKRFTKEDLGREKFRKLISNWKSIRRKQIILQINKLGLALDWNHFNSTLNSEITNLVTKIFVQFYNEKIIYQNLNIVSFCPSCKTVLSSQDITQKKIKGTILYYKSKLKTKRDKYIVITSTRPETILGTVAVAVNPKDTRYKNLIGKELILPIRDQAVPIIADESVNSDSGTGAIAISPANDKMAFNLAIKHHLKPIEIIDHNARMTDKVPIRYRGLDRMECRQKVFADLHNFNLIEKEEDFIHNLGHCQHCNTITEPLISKQWFLRTSNLAKPVLEAIEKREITFFPEKWTTVFLNSKYRFQEWCISRQLWWGYKIPAYICSNCSHLMVEEIPPEKCDKCHHQEIKQDPDVIDPMLAVILWPFASLGWHKNSTDFTHFYPTSIGISSINVFFSWLIPTIMMGIHFGKNIPFREAIIYGHVEEEKNQKKSETNQKLNNPLSIIEKFGTDALRFALAIQSRPGMNISFSTSRVRCYRSFANKIWNASRYILLNLEGDEDFDIDFLKTTDADKWILHSLNKTIEKINDLMDNSKINEAAALLYQFFWHEYCDWYLEFAKNDLDNFNTRKTLKFTLYKTLQLLHPFMPYITEEISQKIRINNKTFLLHSKFPSFKSSLVFSREFTYIEVLKKVIKETRKTRAENKINPQKKIMIYLKTESKKEGTLLNRNLKYFDILTKSSKTEIVEDFQNLNKGFKGICLNWEILLPIDSDEFRLNELSLLEKELSKIEKQANNLEKKITLRGSLKKNQEITITNYKKNLQEIIDKRDKIKKTIKNLS